MALSHLKNIHHSHYGAVMRNSTHDYIVQGRLRTRSVLESTVVHLQDPKSQEEILIIGTCNLSTKFAYRTRALLQDFKPSSVIVQASPVFEQYSKGAFATAEEFHEHLELAGYIELWQDTLNQGRENFRSWIFEYRAFLMKTWLNMMMRTPKDWWKVFLPGLEMKFAVDAAESLGSSVFYDGEDFDLFTYKSLRLEKKFDVIYPMWKYWFGLSEAWYNEARDMQRLLRRYSLKELSENVFDRDKMAWFVRFGEKLLPNQKRALIDLKDVDLFWKIEKYLEGPRKCAVVNQWHLDRIEKLWRNSHGIGIKRAPTSGTEDLEDDYMDAYMTGIDEDRKRVETITGRPMASKNRQLIPYPEETNSHYGL